MDGGSGKFLGQGLNIFQFLSLIQVYFITLYIAKTLTTQYLTLWKKNHSYRLLSDRIPSEHSSKSFPN